MVAYKRRTSHDQRHSSLVKIVLRFRSIALKYLVRQVSVLRKLLVERMKSTWLLLVLLNEILLGNAGNEHVHFKIHVPEIIKHHVHTKTIFIHKAIPRKKYVPKKKEIPKKKIPSEVEHPKEGHHEWKYWSSYFHQDDHGQSHDASHDIKQEEVPNDVSEDYNQDSHKSVRDSYFPQRESSYGENLSPMHHENYANGVIGYSYPPQYANRPQNSDHGQVFPSHSYEEGYRKGLFKESAGILTNELNRFNYDAQEEEELEEQEEEEEEVDGSEHEKGDEEVITTHAGRYFVDEDDPDKDRSDSIKDRVSRRSRGRRDY